MTYHFRPAVREAIGLLIGLSGASGSGKTYSALRIATGIVGKDKKFAVIDTEARRSLHYADMFNFDMCELNPPFTPQAYADIIKTADKQGYGAIVIDSVSHEWAGEGGILDIQEQELQRMAGEDAKRRESCKMASWIKPKMAHKQMLQRLLQVHAHLILCFRAEEKVKMERIEGKMQIVPIGFQPICSKELPYELTVSFMLLPDKPGIPQPLKLQEQHKKLFPLDQPLSELSGKLIAQWAKGKDSKQKRPVKEKNVIPDRNTQIKEIINLFNNFGIKTKTNILFEVSKIIHREVKSLKEELTNQEIINILDHLRGLKLNGWFNI
jgi:hypothetical protein